MNLKQLLTPYTSHILPADINVTGLVTDNRDVSRGDCFIALAGITHHGKEFIADAIACGASAVLLDAADMDGFEAGKEISVPVIAIEQLAEKVNQLLLDFYRQESDVNPLKLLAVTGTNGKTSITRFAAQLSHGLNHAAGVMGTLGFGIWPNIVASKNTTPELAVLLRQFSRMKAQGAEHVMMEVSSHGIAQKRIEGLQFESAVFSNLSQDHLDYHGTMEDYFHTKRSLFLASNLKHAVINVDDEYGQRLMADPAITAEKMSYGFSAQADVRVVTWTSNGSSTKASISTPWGDADFTLNMVGDFNLANVLAAISLLVLNNVASLTDVISALDQVSSAPGRMQTYSKVGCANAVIDFAHTPAALENVLSTLAKDINSRSADSRLAVVFGCGGNRDTDKRPKMANIAQAIADRVIFTADNPRTEKVENIIQDMQAGLPSNLSDKADKQISIEIDRSKAIQTAVAELTANDVLLIAGKGHENYQDIDGVKIPYSDESVLLGLGYRLVNHFHGNVEGSL